MPAAPPPLPETLQTQTQHDMEYSVNCLCCDKTGISLGHGLTAVGS